MIWTGFRKSINLIDFAILNLLTKLHG